MFWIDVVFLFLFFVGLLIFVLLYLNGVWIFVLLLDWEVVFFFIFMFVLLNIVEFGEVIILLVLSEYCCECG